VIQKTNAMKLEFHPYISWQRSPQSLIYTSQRLATYLVSHMAYVRW